jgi:alpha-N-acetylglucosaminidase
MALSTDHTRAQPDPDAVRALIRRVLPGKEALFDIRPIAPARGQDVFEVESVNGRITLAGNNGVSVASALKYYLHEYCHASITWNGTNLELPDPLPPVATKVRKITPYRYRHYLNYCTFNYTMAWWDWERWEREIDWMAMNGINMPLAITGEAYVWRQVYQELGFGSGELENFFSGPAYLAWFWMGNLDGWGGPLPGHWIDSHRELQKKILARERSLGMTPVLPAFTGHVPPCFNDKFPDRKLKKTNWGSGFSDVYILDPSDAMFGEIGRRFIEAQTVEYGTDHLYSADTFNENIPPSGEDDFLESMARRVYQSMAAADPEAVWVMQAWMFSFNARFWQPAQVQALLKAVADDHMIILDLWSETNPVWNRTDAYYGKPWIWNMLHNFGGNISLYGRMRHVAYDPALALHDPDAGRLAGIGITPEGIEQNPVIYELMAANVWRSDPIDLKQWLPAYARRRYGQHSASANQAWDILKNTVYSGGKSEGGPESIVTGRPTFARNTAWTHTTLTYDARQLLRAWDLFIKASDTLGATDGFCYDLVDLTRQVLGNYATPLQQSFAEAYRDGDREAFHARTALFLALIDDMDRLLATRRDFLLGPWLASARSWGTTEAESDLDEFNARDLITLWGDKDSPLHDYACRQWSGLLKGFYKPRWERFFAYVDSCMDHHQAVDIVVFDEKIKQWEWDWVHAHDTYATMPEGEAVATARALYKKYRKQASRVYHEKTRA